MGVSCVREQHKAVGACAGCVPRKSGMPAEVEMPAPVCTTTPPPRMSSASSRVARAVSSSGVEYSFAPSCPPRSSGGRCFNLCA